MRIARVLPVIAAMAALGSCQKKPAPAPETPAPVDMMVFGNFEYKERMELPGEVTAWNGKLVRTSGYVNPMKQATGLTEFDLVKDRNSCCFGQRPRINHFFAVRLKPGQTADQSTDPVTVVGRLKVDDQWDGDWQVGLYFLDDAYVVK